MTDALHSLLSLTSSRRVRVVLAFVVLSAVEVGLTGPLAGAALLGRLIRLGGWVVSESKRRSGEGEALSSRRLLLTLVAEAATTLMRHLGLDPAVFPPDAIEAAGASVVALVLGEGERRHEGGEAVMPTVAPEERPPEG